MAKPSRRLVKGMARLRIQEPVALAPTAAQQVSNDLALPHEDRANMVGVPEFVVRAVPARHDAESARNHAEAGLSTGRPRRREGERSFGARRLFQRGGRASRHRHCGPSVGKHVNGLCQRLLVHEESIGPRLDLLAATTLGTGDRLDHDGTAPAGESGSDTPVASPRRGGLAHPYDRSRRVHQIGAPQLSPSACNLSGFSSTTCR